MLFVEPSSELIEENRKFEQRYEGGGALDFSELKNDEEWAEFRAVAKESTASLNPCG